MYFNELIQNVSNNHKTSTSQKIMLQQLKYNIKYSGKIIYMTYTGQILRV